MKSNIIAIIVIILIVVIGVGVWAVMSSQKENEEGTTPTSTTEEEEGTAEEEGEAKEEETMTEGKIDGIPLPEYPKTTKIMEQRSEEAGDFLVMYSIEGIDRAEEIKDFYKTKLAAEGWKLDSETFIEEGWMLTFSKGEDYSLQIAVGYDEDEKVTHLTLTYDGPSTEEKENPYDSAKEVEPVSELNTAFHNDFKAVFDSVFGGSKLTSAESTESWEEIDYIVKRKITEEDAQEIKDLLEEKGYETISSKAGNDKYDYVFSKEVLEKEYEDIEVDVWLMEEGNNQQKVLIDIYK